MTGSSTFDPKATPCPLGWSLVNTKPCSQTHVGVFKYSNKGQSSLRCLKLPGVKERDHPGRKAKRTERFMLDDVFFWFCSTTLAPESRLSEYL